MTSTPKERRWSYWGKSRSPRKRRPKRQLVVPGNEIELPTFKDDATIFDLLKCAIRSFILNEADSHIAYHDTKHLVALPCVITAWSDSPDSDFHMKCLTTRPLEDWQRKSYEREAESGITLSK